MQENNGFTSDIEVMSALPQSLESNGRREAKRASTNNSQSIPVPGSSVISSSQQREKANDKESNSESAGRYSSEAYFRMLYDKASESKPVKRPIISGDQVKRDVLYIIFVVYVLNRGWLN